MKVGTKSLLFGVHQFIWHPITVYLAWCKLYGRPNMKETICILIHDWGYWSKPNMDGEEGEQHPELGASIARKFLGVQYYKLCLYHSRHYARNSNEQPSRLCWADKLSIIYEPSWFYLFRAKLSGELIEYRKTSTTAGFTPLTKTDKEWFDELQQQFIKLGNEQKNSVAFANPIRY